MTALRGEINRLKLDLTKSTNISNRLQAEKETNERSHGQRTALVGMLETQLSEMNDKHAQANAQLESTLYELSQKKELLQANQEQTARLEASLEESRLQGMPGEPPERKGISGDDRPRFLTEDEISSFFDLSSMFILDTFTK